MKFWQKNLECKHFSFIPNRYQKNDQKLKKEK